VSNSKPANTFSGKIVYNKASTATLTIPAGIQAGDPATVNGEQARIVSAHMDADTVWLEIKGLPQSEAVTTKITWTPLP